MAILVVQMAPVLPSITVAVIHVIAKVDTPPLTTSVSIRPFVLTIPAAQTELVSPMPATIAVNATLVLRMWTTSVPAV